MPRMDENKVYRIGGKARVEYCDDSGMVQINRFSNPAEMGEFIERLVENGYREFSIDK